MGTILRMANPPAKARQVQRLSESSNPTIYGCCGLFDLCPDVDLMSLSFQGVEPFLDWIGWESSLECKVRKSFIPWIRPARQVDGVTATPGYLADPCADPYSVEWGRCDFLLEDFGRLRRDSPVRDVTENALKLCAAQPRYRLDGSLILDDREYDLRLATEVLLQDLKRLVMTGNSAIPGQFDGFGQLVATGYTDPDGRRCRSMDSIIVDWGIGVCEETNGTQTWNGAAMAAGLHFLQVLHAVYRRIRQRISWAPALAAQRMQPGDMALVMPGFLVPCFLDCYACWSLCEGSSVTNKMIVLDTYEGRQFRDGLNGGMFGFGEIALDGFRIPLIGYDWGTISGPTTGDIYLMTSKVGNVRLVNGQYLDMRPVPAVMPDAMYTDRGRLLTWPVTDHTCVKQVVEMRPRILRWAPWAQARFEDVICNGPAGPLSPDPEETSFFIESSFTAAECPQ